MTFAFCSSVQHDRISTLGEVTRDKALSLPSSLQRLVSHQEKQLARISQSLHACFSEAKFGVFDQYVRLHSSTRGSFIRQRFYHRHHRPRKMRLQSPHLNFLPYECPTQERQAGKTRGHCSYSAPCSRCRDVTPWDHHCLAPSSGRVNQKFCSRGMVS